MQEVCQKSCRMADNCCQICHLLAVFCPMPMPRKHPPHAASVALAAVGPAAADGLLSTLPPVLEAWLETLPEPHVLFDGRYRILAANSAYRREFGQNTPVLGRTCHAVSHHSDVPCDQAGETCPLARALYSGQRERVLHLHHTSRGEEYVHIELQPLHTGPGQAQYFLEKIHILPLAASHPDEQPLLGRAPAFRAALELMARVAPSETCVLLHGETGTGKTLAARAIHQASARAAHPLVVVDACGQSEAVLEAELFGLAKGAGGQGARSGLVEAAHGGSLLLEEVGDLPLGVQAKLLRLLESGTYRRVGSSELRRADVRLLATTRHDLPALVRQGRLRADWYHCLSAFPITLPALRERAGDIPLLVQALLQRIAPGRRLELAPQALQPLAQHPFAGNVRELRNVLVRAALLTDGHSISAATVQRALGFVPRQIGVDANEHIPPTPSAPRRALRALQDDALRAALHGPQGTRLEQARALGISPRTLYRRLRALQEQQAAGAPRAEGGDSLI